MVLLGIRCAGYLFRPLSWARRFGMWMAAGLLMMPLLTWLAPGVADASGLALGLALVVSERRVRALGRTAEVAAAPGSPP